MMVIGLTGSIATGKSTTAQMIAHHRIPVFDADKAVHAMMQPGTDAFAEIKQVFPKAIKGGAIDRRALGKIIFPDDAKRNTLEGILHPRVRAAEIAFIEHGVIARQRAVLLDIPLLFETGADALCDGVIVTYCPPFIQRQRMMRRANMTEEKYQQIIDSQMSQDEKLRRADAVIETSLGKGHTMRRVKTLLKELGFA